jgi:N-acyl-D-amino-acid deacylase
MKIYILLILFVLSILSCKSDGLLYDLVIINGTIYDGTGNKSYIENIGIKGDKILYIGESNNLKGKKTIDAKGKAVSPGFINMLSWGYNSLLKDGRSLSDLKQGVTLEVFGEGTSPGPRGNPGEKTYISFFNSMDSLVKKGVSTNIASFIGAATLRINSIGYENRDATNEELDEMKQSVEKAMTEGAMGIGSSLIYAPGDYANTNELIEISKIASKYGGMYISHMRNEDNKVLDALEELINISQEANIAAEIYHLKASRKANWHLLDSIIKRVEIARKKGLKITADMYTYNASSTGLTGVIPTWVQEGGHRAWINRMKQPRQRKKLIKDIEKELKQQPPNGILMVGFKKDSMAKIYLGKTIEQAAQMRNQSPENTIIDLIIEDDSRIQCIYFSMSKENIRKKIQIPWLSFCSDAGSYSDITKNFRTHPRAFGSFARVLGKFSRDEGIISLEEAVRKLSGFPATNLGLHNRGFLKKGYFADIVIFDPLKISDKATFNKPLQYAKGVDHVFVNGEQVLENGNHTEKFPGIYIKGRGAKIK